VGRLNKYAKNTAVVRPKPALAYDGFLTEEERIEIEAEILADIEAEQRRLEKEKYRKEATRRMRVERELEEEQVSLLVDLPGHAQKIVLDGVPFYHGHIVEVSQSKAETLLDIMDKAWRHEESVGGANGNAYRKPYEERLSGLTQTSTRGSAVAHAPISPMSQGRLTPSVTPKV